MHKAAARVLPSVSEHIQCIKLVLASCQDVSASPRTHRHMNSTLMCALYVDAQQGSNAGGVMLQER